MVDGFIDDAYELRVEKFSAAGETSLRSISPFVRKPIWHLVFLRCSPRRWTLERHSGVASQYLLRIYLALSIPAGMASIGLTMPNG